MPFGSLRVIPVVCLLVVLAGCATPPSKELSQAQGALDAARAAGAAEYATEEFTAANDTLARAHDAVSARDYRAALSYALDASARAQAAAKSAVEGRVKAQSAAEQALGEMAAAVTQLETRLAAPEARRVPAAARRRAQQVLTAATTALATARKEVAAGQLSATGALAPHRDALGQASASLEPLAAPARPRPRR
jgi:hypothetical protein